MKQTIYTSQEVEQIMNVFSKPNNMIDRKQLAKKLDRKLSTLQSKYSYEKSRDSKGIAHIRDNQKIQKVQKIVSDVIVTHINKPIESSIVIGDAKIILNTNRFKVNGTLIEC